MASKLPGRPNLALAGKREAPGTAPKSGESKRGRGGGRGRGRGGSDRGKQFPQKRQELIQTGGVFSEGLGGDFPSRKKEKDSDVQQFSVKKKDGCTEKKKESNAETNPEEKKVLTAGKTSFKGWDELWESDDELDDAELRSLMPKGFINDYKRGTVLPYVLPHEDKPQFVNVLNKTARAALQEDDEEMEDDEKRFKRENGVSARKERKMAQELVSMMEASTSELLHLQLPSVIGSICHELEQNSLDDQMEVDGAENGQILQNGQKSDNALPTSRRIGKIQVTRKGRLLLQIGGYSINITTKATTGKQQGTVLLETEPTIDPMMSPTANARAPESADNVVYFIGNVKHNLVGSMEWGELNKNAKNAAKKEEEKNTKQNDVAMAEPVDNQEIEKMVEIQKGWKNQAEQWASGSLT